MNTLQKLSIALILLFSTTINAQDYNINFEHTSWKKVLKMAKKQNKPIFVDAYTDWCGPCKTMSKEVFTQKEVADYFNTNFICVKMDMEKGEGVKLKGDWEIKAFPTFLYFNKKGEIIHRVVGAFDAPSFLGYSKLAIGEKSSASYLQKEYDKGNREPKFMYNYLVSLRLGYQEKLEREIAKDYISSLPKEDIVKQENWNIIENFLKDPLSDEFMFMVDNRDKMIENSIDSKEIDEMIYLTLKEQLITWKYWGSDKEFETEKENKLIDYLRVCTYSKAPMFLGKFMVDKYSRTEKTDEWFNTVDYIVNFNIAESPSQITDYARIAAESFDDKESLYKALLWINIADKKEKRVEHRAEILLVKSQILEKSGNKSESELMKVAADKANEEAEKKGTIIYSVPMIKMN